jgi:hypothetical protein
MQLQPIRQIDNPWLLADQHELRKNVATGIVFVGALLGGVACLVLALAEVL